VGILFPPSPPLPANITLVSHQSSNHGLDDWVYETTLSSCDVITFYQSIGGQCDISPEYCQNPENENLRPQTTCTGESHFSIFAMRWDAWIEPGTDTEHTNLGLTREVFWTGAVPPREFPLPESEDLGNN
jgi:hypothetical protein